MLLTCLQGQAIGGLTLRVDGDPYQAAWKRTLEFISYRHVTGVRAAEAQGNTETLRGADHDICPPFSRGLEQGKGKEVSGYGNQAATLVYRLCQRTVIADVAINAGILQQYAECVGIGCLCGRSDLYLYVHRLGARLHDFQRLRQDVVSDIDSGGSRSAIDPQHQGHSLCGGSCLVQH